MQIEQTAAGNRGFIHAMIKDLEKNFPTPKHTPKSTMEEVMYKAGQQYVLEYIERKYIHGR